MLSLVTRLRWAQVHRVLGLALGAWVLLMAVTGGLLAMEPRIDAARHLDQTHEAAPGSLPGTAELTRLWREAAPDRVERVVFATNGVVRLQVVDESGARRVLVADLTSGQQLSTEADGDSLRSTLINLHDSLLLGEPGRVAATALGVLFVVLAGCGLVLAWPAGGLWRSVLKPPRGLPQVAMMRGWHRWAGFWLATLFAPLLLTGVWINVSVFLSSDTSSPAPRSTPGAVAADLPALLAGAVARSAVALPDHRLKRVELPRADGDALAVLMQPHHGLAAGYSRRVWFDAADGRLLGVEAPQSMASVAGLMSAAYALHTGLFLGPAGEWLALSFAILCLASALLGLAFWWLRRRQTQRAAARKASR